jgi:hypothetical protein
MLQRLRRKKIILIVAGIFFLVIAVFAVVYLTRPPVLIITDTSFALLYGPDRLIEKQRQVSISLFRQVVFVTVSEHAGPNLVAIAAEEAFPSPWAVVFPYRYIGGARSYKENNPEVPVVVMGGRIPLSTGLIEPDFLYVRTDTAVDLYRAGLSAALFAGEKNVLVFDDGLFPQEYREFLIELLASRGFLGNLIFLSAAVNITSFSEIGCVILTGPNFRFLDQNPDIPVILFSWVDPALTPETVKLVFDDSPLALLVTALKYKDVDEILIPSAAITLPDRIEERRDFRILRNLVKENFY